MVVRDKLLTPWGDQYYSTSVCERMCERGLCVGAKKREEDG